VSDTLSEFAEGTGVLADWSDASAWKDPRAMQAGIGRYSQANIDAVVAYCEYLYRRTETLYRRTETRTATTSPSGTAKTAPLAVTP